MPDQTDLIEKASSAFLNALVDLWPDVDRKAIEILRLMLDDAETSLTLVARKDLKRGSADINAQIAQQKAAAELEAVEARLAGKFCDCGCEADTEAYLRGKRDALKIALNL